MRFQTLGALIGMQRIRDAAWDETCDLTERHDVPRGDDVPADLRDVMGFFWKTRNGYRVSGRLLPSDMLQGSPSAALPLILVLGSMLGCLSLVLGGSHGWASYVVTPLFLIYLAIVYQLFGLAMCLIMFLGVGVAIGSNWVPLPRYLVGGEYVALVLVAFAPRWYADRVSSDRAHKLAQYGTSVTQADTGMLTDLHMEPRRLQFENATHDATPFIRIGTATGFFRAFMDGYAPDPGLPFGLTCADLSTHFAVFGKTGTGKTSGLLRPIANAFLASGYGGALILDGKGQLAREFKGRFEDYLLVEPGDDCQLALIEGLEPEDVVQTLASVRGSDSKADGGENGFFVNSGRQLLLYVAIVVREMNRIDAARYPWTFSALVQMLNAMVMPETSKRYVDVLAAQDGKSPMLRDAIAYFRVQLPAMDERTRANIAATCSAWLAPVMSHPKVRPWASLSTGVDVTRCLRGGLVGVNAPATEYGDAGAVITAMVKARIFAAVRRRAADWSRNGTDKPILMLVDEAQAVVGRAEQELFPVARSLGLIGVYATQSVDEFYERFGEHGALALLNNFRSFAVFDSSEKTFEWASRHLGWSEVRQQRFRSGHSDPGMAARLAAGSPIFDPEHPDREYMKGLARDRVGGMWSVVKGALQIVQGKEADINLDVETEFSHRVEPLLSVERADAYLAAPGMAVVQVQRGQVRRRDVVRLNPVY